MGRDTFPCSHRATGDLAAPHSPWPLRAPPRATPPFHPSRPQQFTEIPLSQSRNLSSPSAALRPPSPPLRPAPPHAAHPHRLPQATGPAPRRRSANPEGRCVCTRSGRDRPAPPASRPWSGRALHAWRPAVGGVTAANGGAAPQSGRALLRAAAPPLFRRRSGQWRSCPPAAPRPIRPGVPGGAADPAKPAHSAPAALVTIVDWRPRQARAGAAANQRVRRAAVGGADGGSAA